MANHATIEWGKWETAKMLRTLNDHYLAGKQPYLCGNTLSIADYFGAALLTLGEIIGNDFHDYPNIESWLQTIKALPSWSEANAAHDGFAAAMQETTFITLTQEV